MVVGMNRRRFLKQTAVATSVTAGMWLHPQLTEAKPPQSWRDAHFAMDSWFYRRQPEIQIKDRVSILKKLGYSGMAYSLGNANQKQWKEFPEALKALDEKGLELTGIVTGTMIHGQTYPERLKKLIASLKGRSTLVLLQLRSSEDRRSSHKGNDRAADVLKRIADDCAKAEIGGLAMYPAKGNWLQEVGHAVTLAAKVKQSNVGVKFNQYSWMQEAKADLGRTLKEAVPYLKCVTINGWDKEEETIKPLGKGDFDTQGIVKTLAKLGYKGPIGTNGYKIPGNVQSNLKQSIAAWKEWSKGL
jgi:sugar phosphate isomerase/epimerase